MGGLSRAGGIQRIVHGPIAWPGKKWTGMEEKPVFWLVGPHNSTACLLLAAFARKVHISQKLRRLIFFHTLMHAQNSCFAQNVSKYFQLNFC